MALVSKRKLSYVSDINRDSGLWTVVVQVVESHRSDVSSAKRGGKPKTYKRYLLVDQHGTKVFGIVYENDIRYFSTSLQPFKRYMISNAALTPAYSFFKVGPYPFSWIITNDIPVELIDDSVMQPLPFSYELCAFKNFAQHADKDTGFNVKGLAVHAFPRKQVTVDSSRREIVLIDESKMPIILTLWNSFGDIEGNIITNNISNTPVIIATNIKATTFHGLSLATRWYSYLLIDPPLNDNPSLQEWFNENKAEVTQLLRNEAYKNTELLLPPPTADKTIDVPTAAATLLTVHTAWVVGQLRLTPSEKKYYLSNCGNCKKKVKAGVDWFLRCSSCGEMRDVEFKCRVPLELKGEDKSLPIVLTSPDVENLTGITATQLRDSHEFGLGLEDDLHAALDKLEVVSFIKKYDLHTLGTPTAPGIRFAAVKTYTVNAIQPAPAAPALLLPGPQETQSTDDVQLFTPNTKKQLTEIDEIIESSTAEQSTPPAKRTLHFMSMHAKVEKTSDDILPCKEAADPNTNVDDHDTPKQSPVKKGKETHKLD